MPFLATLGGKIGLGLGSVALVLGIYWAWEHSVRSDEKAILEAERAQEVQAQQETVRDVEQDQHSEKVASLERLIAEKDRFNAQFIEKAKAKEAEARRLREQLESLKHQQPEVHHEIQYIEVEKEVEKPIPCVVPDQLVADVNDYARMLDPFTHRGVPEDGTALEGARPTEAGPVTCAALVKRIEVLTHRLGNTLIGFRELFDFYQAQYAINQQFHKEHTP